jgi:hypothetical protein
MTGCMIDGRMIGTFPDEYCLQNPEDEKCVPNKKGNCPEDFVRTANFTNPRFVPLSYEDAEHAKRERQIRDQYRCSLGYDLENIEEPEEEYGNVG